MTETETKGEGWRNTILAGLANYIDSGSIVAGSVALGLWNSQGGAAACAPKPPFSTSTATAILGLSAGA